MGWFFAGMLTTVIVAKLVWRRRWRRFRRGGGPRGFMMRRFLRQIDASPDQEVAITAAIDDVWGVAQEVKSEVSSSRHHVAGAMRSERFDSGGLDDTLGAQTAGVDRLREALIDGLSRVHTVLNPAQRQQVAALVERGPHGRRGRC